MGILSIIPPCLTTHVRNDTSIHYGAGTSLLNTAHGSTMRGTYRQRSLVSKCSSTTIKDMDSPTTMIASVATTPGKGAVLAMEKEVEVVAEASGWLKVMSDGTVHREWSGTEEAALPLITPVPPSHPAFIDGVSTRDVVINGDTSLRLRLYLPHNHQDKKLPLLVHFHGGGFCVSRSDWRMYHHFYARLASDLGIMCASVDFRLAPEHRLPAAVEDCIEALRWIAADGLREDEWLSKYADLGKCGLIGESSGGNLVHEVARYAASDEGCMEPLRVMCGVSIHPGYVRAEKSRSELETPPDSALLTPEMVDTFLRLSAPDGASGRSNYITNPMDAFDLSELRFPQLLVCVADRDLIRDTEMEYVEAMRKAGHDVDVLVSENTGHCFHLNEIAIQLDPHTAHQTTLLIQSIHKYVGATFGDKSGADGNGC